MKNCMAIILIGLALVISGCFFDFEPTEYTVVMSPGESQLFSVNDPGEGWKVVWALDGVEVSQDLSYTYTAEGNPGTEMILHRLEAQSWQDRPILRRMKLFGEPWSQQRWEIKVLAPGGPEPCYLDEDGDGHGNIQKLLQIMDPPTNCVNNHADCDDRNPARYPGNEETCNGIDDNCDDRIDDGFPLTIYYCDADRDGFGRSSCLLEACAPPNGYVARSGDCDDYNSTINPAAEDSTCNGVDENCDGLEPCFGTSE